MTNPLEPMMADLIRRIDEGVPPWRQPWQGGADPSLPLRSDGQPFSGTNCWILASVGAMRGYVSPYWFTFKQALGIEAPVRKGETGTDAILYKTRIVDEPSAGDDRDGKVMRYLRGYKVFNAEQLTDCPAEYLKSPHVDPELRAAARHTILDSVPADLRHGGSKAFYVPAFDYVQMPPVEAFDDVEAYQRTLSHEYAHWTGGSRRLNRVFGERFGDQAYAFEELVAELASCLLGLHLGLSPQGLDNHAAYLANWSRILRDRPGALIEASSHAQKAVDHLVAYSEPVAADDRLAA